jgi:hypothetical protein
MDMRSFSWLTLTSLACFTVTVHAQLPGAVPPGSAAAATTAAGAAANNVGAPQMGFCAKCLQACEDCKRRLCATPLGAMLNNMTKPLSAMSGGIIPNFCPEKPGAEELAKPGSEGAAANIKKDAVEAKARRSAVRYMGTVDCRYYPEAEGALIAALRTDGIECVRWEAALVLGKGCCCSKKIIEALTHAVSCSEKDGNPAERSERVRFAACLALERCLACYSEPVEENKNKTPVEPGKAPTENKDRVEPMPPLSSRLPDRQTILNARAAIKKLHDRYGLNASNQISVVAEEAVKLSPVPAQGQPVTQPVVADPVQQAPAQLNAVPVSTGPTAAAPKREPRSLFSVLRGDSAPVTQIVNVQPVQTVPTQPVQVSPMSVPVKPMTIQPLSMPTQTMSPTPAQAIINAAPQPKEARPVFQYAPSQPVLPDLSKVEVKETNRPVFQYAPTQPALPDLSKVGDGK